MRGGGRHAMRVLEFACKDRQHVVEFVMQLVELQDQTHHAVRLVIEGLTVAVGGSDVDTHEEFCSECRELFVETSSWDHRHG